MDTKSKKPEQIFGLLVDKTIEISNLHLLNDMVLITKLGGI